MVKALFFSGLAGSFIGLLAWLLMAQLPTDVSLFALFEATENLDLLLIQSYSLPRITVALLAGGILGLASLLLQQAMNNPLASDNTLGISAGAQFALFLSTVFVPSWLDYGAGFIALAGAGVSLLLVLGLAMRKTLSPLLLILAGLVVNLYFGAFSTLIMLLYPEESRGLAQWGAGSLVQESWRSSQLLTLQAVIPIGLILLLIRPLTILSLNEGNAQSLGVPVAKLRLFGVLIGSFLIAAVVSHIGMLGFIGLAAATLVRQLGIRQFKYQLLGAFLVGGLLLAVTDLLLQLLNHYYGVSLPTGAVTALLGTPLLLWLMFRAMAHTGRLTEEKSPAYRRFHPLTFWLLLGGLGLAIAVALLLGQGASGWFWAEKSQFESLFELRYPRILIALAVGILLAVAGVFLQRLTLNPMASPELLGVSGGTGMGILAVLFLFSAEQTELLLPAGILGAVIALLILTVINQRNGMLPEKILLTGISLSALFGTIQTLVIAGGDPRANRLLAWSSGSTQALESEFAVPLVLLSLILLGSSLIFSRWLEILALNASVAQSLGLNLRKSRLVLILFSALLTALATLVIGPLSFIGLLVPQISRFLGAVKARTQILTSALLGGLMMVFADFLGRQLIFPYEIPAGLVATLIGGSYFLLMVRRL